MTERDIEFPKGQPRHWYAEYDVENKTLEIRLGKFIIRLPQELILSWFMCQEYNTRISEEP